MLSSLVFFQGHPRGGRRWRFHELLLWALAVLGVLVLALLRVRYRVALPWLDLPVTAFVAVLLVWAGTRRAGALLARAVKPVDPPVLSSLPIALGAEPGAPPAGVVVVTDQAGLPLALHLLEVLALREDPRRTLLICSSRREVDAALQDRLRRLEGRLHLRVVHVLEKPADGWTGDVGRVTGELLERYRPPDYRLAHYLVAGSERTIDNVRSALLRQGVPAHRVSARACG